MDDLKTTQEVCLKDGSIFCIKMEEKPGFQNVGISELNFNDACNSIKQIGTEIYEVFQELKPKRGSVEFGIELSVSAGKLTSLVVDGRGKANFTIKLEWES